MAQFARSAALSAFALNTGRAIGAALALGAYGSRDTLRPGRAFCANGSRLSTLALGAYGAVSAALALRPCGASFANWASRPHFSALTLLSARTRLAHRASFATFANRAGKAGLTIGPRSAVQTIAPVAEAGDPVFCSPFEPGQAQLALGINSLHVRERGANPETRLALKPSSYRAELLSQNVKW
ncbi:hypothetical protein [Methylopila sp. 73B]|uniref:hypothetical protein n=1 Tax=Methylopila sp. 73B TaxID=1120792 RepID=UPI001FD97B24|nr:hypothetical protein [Methylopila sp. 73B]